MAKFKIPVAATFKKEVVEPIQVIVQPVMEERYESNGEVREVEKPAGITTAYVEKVEREDKRDKEIKEKFARLEVLETQVNKSKPKTISELLSGKPKREKKEEVKNVKITFNLPESDAIKLVKLREKLSSPNNPMSTASALLYAIRVAVEQQKIK